MKAEDYEITHIIFNKSHLYIPADLLDEKTRPDPFPLIKKVNEVDTNSIFYHLRLVRE